MPPPQLEFDFLASPAEQLRPAVEQATAAFKKASAQHGAILHCAQRSEEGGGDSDPSAARKLAKAAVPHKFCFVFAASDAELLELVTKHVASTAEKPAEEGAATTAAGGSSIRWCYAFATAVPPSSETILALVEKLQIPREGASDRSSGTNNKNTNDNNRIVVALPPHDNTSPCWSISISSVDDKAAAAAAAAATTSLLTVADRMWTACLERTGLNLIVGFWFGSQKGNAEYICATLYNKFVNERGSGDQQPAAVKEFIRSAKAAAATATKTGARAVVPSSNAPLCVAGSLIVMDTLNSFVKKDMLSDSVLQRYRCVHIIVCSTHGDGDFPDNADRVKKYLAVACAHSKAAVASQSLFFSVLALGDTNYTKFCEAGQLVNRKLKELGATCILPIRQADDGIGLELVVEPYSEQELWPPLEKQVATLVKQAAGSAEIPLSTPLLAGKTQQQFPAMPGAAAAAAASSSSAAATQARPSAFDASASGYNYQISTLILFSPSALLHAGALQSVLVNAGMHEPGSLPVLLPIRLLYDGGESKEETRFDSDAAEKSNNKDKSPTSPFTANLAATMQYQRVPPAKNLFILTSSDAAWWDDTTETCEEHKHHRICQHISQVCSGVRLFAYFDMDQTLSKSLEQSKAAAMEAFHLSKKTVESFDFLQAQQQQLQMQDQQSSSSTSQQQQQQQQQQLYCGFTPWLRSLVRWLAPRTLGKATASVTEAVLSVVDSVVHGHHDRGLFVPALDASALNRSISSTSSSNPQLQISSASSAASRSESLHILSLKRTVVLFSRTTFEEQQLAQQQQLQQAQQQQQQQQMTTDPQQQQQLDPALRGQSLAEDVARGVATAVLHGLDVGSAEIGHFKQAGFPRKAVFVFVLGPDTSKGVRRLIDHINSIMLANSSSGTITATGDSSNSQPEHRRFPLSGMSFAVFGIEWMHRPVQDYGGALELELVLQEAGARKIHSTGLARTGAIDAVLSKWRRSLKRSIEVCNTTTGYFEPPVSASQQQQQQQQQQTLTPPIISRQGSGSQHDDVRMNPLSLADQAALAARGGNSTPTNHKHLLAHNPLKQRPLGSSIPSLPCGEEDDDHEDTTSGGEDDDINNNDNNNNANKRAAAATATAAASSSTRGQMSSVATAMMTSQESWSPYLSLRPTPAAITARTDVSIVVTLSSTGFSNIFARRCAIEARILGYNVVFAGSVTRAEEFLALPTSCVVLVCGTRPPRRLLNGLSRLSKARADVLSHLSFGCIGVSSMPLRNQVSSGSAPCSVVLPGAQLAVALENSCGAQRVFPSAVVDSPSAAETNGVLWLRGTLGALARVVSRRAFLRSQNLPALPPPPSALSVTQDGEDDDGDDVDENENEKNPGEALALEKQRETESAQRRIVFLHSSTPLSESMARDMFEEAVARNFQPRLLPLTAFKELLVASTGDESSSSARSSSSSSSSPSIAASCLVFVLDETTSAATRSLTKVAASLARNELSQARPHKLLETASCVLTIVDRRNNSKSATSIGATAASSSSSSSSPSQLLVSALERSFAAAPRSALLCPSVAVDVSDTSCVAATSAFREDLFTQALKHASALLSKATSAVASAEAAEVSKTSPPGTEQQDQSTEKATEQQLHQPDTAFVQQQNDVAVNSDEVHTDNNDGNNDGRNSSSSSDDAAWFMGRIVETYPMTSEVTSPPVIFALFEIILPAHRQQQQITWTPGDAIQVMPENDGQEVEAILAMLGLRGDEPFLPPWDPSVKDSRFPSAPVYAQIKFPPCSSGAAAAGANAGAAAVPPVTVRDVLLRHLSLKVHSKEVCNMMERYVTDPQHRAVLRMVSSGGGAAAAALGLPASPGSAGNGSSSPASDSSSTSPATTNSKDNNNATTKNSSPLFSSSSSSRREIYLIDVLQRIRESVRQIPLRGFVETLSALQPRCYSITTSPLSHPNHIGIAYKVVGRGVCTNWMLRMCELASEQRTLVELPMKLRPAPEFRMPRQPATPMILIGPGTGVAPFMSFLAHREALKAIMSKADSSTNGSANSGIHKAAISNGVNSLTASGLGFGRKKSQQQLQDDEREQQRPGDIHLYFGCRSKYHDFLFQEELESWKRTGVLTGLHTAFSQDSNGGAWFGGLYVQDLLRESGPDLCRMIVEQDGHVYVCGDASSMARDVHQVLVDILVEFRGFSVAQAVTKLNEMQERGAYQRDIW